MILLKHWLVFLLLLNSVWSLWYWDRLHVLELCIRASDSAVWVWWAVDDMHSGHISQIKYGSPTRSRCTHHILSAASLRIFVSLDSILLKFNAWHFHKKNKLTNILIDRIWLVVEQLMGRPVGFMVPSWLTGWIAQPSSCSYATFYLQRETDCWGILYCLPLMHRRWGWVLWLLVNKVSGEMDPVKWPHYSQISKISKGKHDSLQSNPQSYDKWKHALKKSHL